MRLRTVLLWLLIATQAHAGWLLLGSPALPKLPMFWIRILRGRREVVPPEQIELLIRPKEWHFRRLGFHANCMSLGTSAATSDLRSHIGVWPSGIRA